MMTRTLTLLLAAAVLVGLAPARAAADNRDMTPGHRCLAAAIQWEQRLETPDGLIRAMALAESGRWDSLDGRSIPWPWTVNNGGSGTFFSTKAEAIREVRRLQRDGETNIDVGCMQVNLHWHGDNFVSLEQAFEPEINMTVAADILARQYRAHRDWQVASGNYHSATPHLHQRYRKKVNALLASLDERAPLTTNPDIFAALQDDDPRVAARRYGRASRPDWARTGGAGIARTGAAVAMAPVNQVANRATPVAGAVAGGVRTPTAAGRGMTLADYRAMARPKAATTRGLNLVRQTP